MSAAAKTRRTHGLGAAAVASAFGALLLAAGPVRAQVPPPSVPSPILTGQQSRSLAPANTAGQSGGEAMAGTFRLTAGNCANGVRGSYFRMIQPGGSATSGPYVQNSDSPCADKTYTPLAPGRDGGLTTDAYQPDPNPAFDNAGGGKADRITKPQKFYGVDFSTATNAKDPQTGVKVAPPAVSRDAGGRLSGDLRAFAASWNNQHFNQGAPKPDGSRSGTTTGPTGTYDAASGAFTLNWTSQIAGGPFNNFTGQWHFEGTFAANRSAASSGGSDASEPTAEAAPAASSPTADAAGASVAAAGATSPRTGPSFSATIGVVALLFGLAGALVVRRSAHD